MIRIVFFLLLLIACTAVKSQNIYSALRLNVNNEYKTKKPLKIIETNSFYSSLGRSINKNVKIFDAFGMLISEERFDEDNKLIARLVYTSDTVRRLKLSRTFERWTKFGANKETAFYKYDTKGCLIETVDKDVGDHIIRTSKIICNDKGFPIELSLSDGNNKTFGKEIAEYLYDKNQVVVSVIANDGRTLTTDTIDFHFHNLNSIGNNRTIRNSNGDMISWESTNFDGSKTRYESEYTYDDEGNCTDEVIFKVTIKSNGKKKRKIDREFRKQYTY
ncbi:hypothetical protein D3C87_621220 [compost metagenome]